MEQNYINKKGYIIYKKNLTEDNIQKIKDDLTILPYVPKDYAQNQESFTIYLENKNKIYIPKFYGIENFGLKDVINKLPKTIKFDNNIEFKGKLRDNQKEGARIILNSIKNEGGGLINAPCGYGKCLGKGTKILMYDGTVKTVENIQIDDLLMGDDSNSRKVISTTKGYGNMYKIYQDFGEDYIVNDVHILCLINIKDNQIYEISVLDLLKRKDISDFYGYKSNIIKFPEPKKILIDSYFLGYWLVCNNTDNILDININNNLILDYINNIENIKLNSLFLIKQNQDNYRIISIDSDNYLYNNIISYGLYECKEIPNDYKFNYVNNRLKLLAGIIDGIGIYINNYYELHINNVILFDDIIFLIGSLGFKYIINDDDNIIKLFINSKFNIIPCIKNDNINIINSIDNIKNNSLLSVIDIKYIGFNEYYGFQINRNGRFLLNDFTVTHNTTLSCYLINEIKEKTLVIVHKDFLLNQWTERIAQFLPEANIGIIKQNKINMAGKDIVIAMLQSISMKDYDNDLFDTFGFVIIDECHRIPCKVFSKALQKINCNKMIGLSATPNRFDGLTKVLKWYIGDIIYKGEKEEKNTNVIVERYSLYSIYNTYNEVILNYNQKPNIPKMINNICNFYKRTIIIINIIKELINENKDRKILLLSDRRNHLNNIYTYITDNNICSCGYYVGGMKNHELKKSESNDLILGTFSMAAEGMDIPQLNTLILASPKSNIEQSIGRILRKKHILITPKIIDIVDTFSLFQRQSLKRNSFYNKLKYKINNYNIDDEGIQLD